MRSREVRPLSCTEISQIRKYVIPIVSEASGNTNISTITLCLFSFHSIVLFLKPEACEDERKHPHPPPPPHTHFLVENEILIKRGPLSIHLDCRPIDESINSD